MRIPTSSLRAIALIASPLALAACSLEVNVHFDGEDAVAAVETEAEAPASPIADERSAVVEGESAPPAGASAPSPNGSPSAPIVPAPPVEVPPPAIGQPPEPNAAIRDALLRPEVPPPPPADLRELRRGPTFTPFTEAPSIRNREEVVEAMREAYPPLLRDAGIGGTARLYFFIEDDGTVGDVRIDQSTGHEALDRAALEVGRVYRFTPAMNRTRRVPVWVSFPVTFQVR